MTSQKANYRLLGSAIPGGSESYQILKKMMQHGCYGIVVRYSSGDALINEMPEVVRLLTVRPTAKALMQAQYWEPWGQRRNYDFVNKC